MSSMLLVRDFVVAVAFLASAVFVGRSNIFADNPMGIRSVNGRDSKLLYRHIQSSDSKIAEGDL